MSRSTVILDRIALVVVGVALAAAGAAACLWGLGLPPWEAREGSLRLGGVAEALSGGGASAPTWILAGGGLLLVVIGLAWLAGHLPQRGSDSLRLPGGDGSGALSVASEPVVDAAAGALESLSPDIVSARGAMLVERGRPLVRVRASVEPDGDLRDIGGAADRMAADLRRVLGRADVALRVELTVASRRRRRRAQ